MRAQGRAPAVPRERTIVSTPSWSQSWRPARWRPGRADVPFALHPRLRALTLRDAPAHGLRRLGRARRSSACRAARAPARDARRDRQRAAPRAAAAPRPRPQDLGALPGAARRRRRADLLDHRATRATTRRALQAICSTGCSPPATPTARRISPRQVRDDLMSIVLAGHETTASQLAWAFQLLAHNPRVQQRLIEELDAGGGEAYLTATVKEVLRHRPVFLFAIPRAVKQPDRDRRLDLPAARAAARVHLPAAPRPGALSRAGGVPPRALPRRASPAPHVAAMGRRAQALSRACTSRRSR